MTTTLNAKVVMLDGAGNFVEATLGTSAPEAIASGSLIVLSTVGSQRLTVRAADADARLWLTPSRRSAWAQPSCCKRAEHDGERRVRRNNLTFDTSRRQWRLVTRDRFRSHFRDGQQEKLRRKSVRVGVRISSFEACSGFTRITAHRIAQQPKVAFVARLRSCQLPGRAAGQLPDQSTIIWVRSAR
jgi:hypothetical protein